MDRMRVLMLIVAAVLDTGAPPMTSADADADGDPTRASAEVGRREIDMAQVTT